MTKGLMDFIDPFLGAPSFDSFDTFQEAASFAKENATRLKLAHIVTGYQGGWGVLTIRDWERPVMKEWLKQENEGTGLWEMLVSQAEREAKDNLDTLEADRQYEED